MGTNAQLEDLSLPDCLRLLRRTSIGRIAIIENGFPVVVPVNYKTVEFDGQRWFAVRTRRGNLLDRGALAVAFEIDGIDMANHQGWSVLVRGTLHHVNPDMADFRDRFDPQPWLAEDREAWVAVEPFVITGRRLHDADSPSPIVANDDGRTNATGVNLGREKCLALLASAEFGHLTLTRHALPTVVPSRYVVYEDRVLIHASTGGDTDVCQDGEVVTLHVDAFQADRTAGWSVSVTGAAHEPTEDERQSVSRAPWLPSGSGNVITLATDLIWGQAFAPKRPHSRHDTGS